MAMLVHSLNFTLSNHRHTHYPQNHRMGSTTPRLLFPGPHSASPCPTYANNDVNPFVLLGLSRRVVLLSISSFVVGSRSLSMAEANQVLSLERYTDTKEGFTLLRPSSWIKVDKAGATVLFEEADKGSNNVGIVVSPVRISSLGEFGTPQFVANKLIEAERRKESTKEAEVVSFSQRSGKEGLQVYEFEYKVDSTRGGMKLVFSAAFIASKKLYLLNISHFDGLEPLDMDKRMILEQVLHSFDIAPST